jgi:polysaccharide chain length determinant protein (PEP-CTERM system associated)
MIDDETDEPPFSALELVGRRKGWLIFTLLAGATAVVSAALFMPDVYRAGATVLIERQQIPDEMVRSTVTGGLEARLQRISQEIMSRSRLQQLVEQFGLYPALTRTSSIERVVDEMRKDIRIDLKSSEQRRADRTTVAFVVSYKGTDPQKVALVANTLASFYIEENLKARERQASGTAEFLNAQLEQMKTRLEAQEQQVTAFKERHLGSLPQQLDANLKTLEQLNSQLRLNNDNQIQVNARRAALATQLAEAEGLGAAGGASAFAVRLAELYRQLMELRTRFTEKYPDVVRVKSEIAQLEALVAQEKEVNQGPRAPTPAVLQLRRSIDDTDIELKRLQGEAESLRQAIDAYRARVESAPKREQQFQSLSRDYETTKDMYRSLMIRQREAELAESMEQRQKGEQFRVIEPATPPEEPNEPNRARIISFGLAVSLGLACAIAFVVDRFDPSVHTVEQVRMLSKLPVLVSVPRIVRGPDRRRRTVKMGFRAATAALALLLILCGSFVFARGEEAIAAIASARALLVRP